MMKQFGFINSPGDLKGIQTNLYKGEGLYLGVTKEGHMYVYSDGGFKRVQKDEAIQILNVTESQLDKIIRRKGQIEVSDLFEDDMLVDAQTRKKSIKTKDKTDVKIETNENEDNETHVKKRSLLSKVFNKRDDANMDIPKGRENRKIKTVKDIKEKDSNLASIRSRISKLEKDISSSNKADIAQLKDDIMNIKNEMITKDEFIKVIEIIVEGDRE